MSNVEIIIVSFYVFGYLVMLGIILDSVESFETYKKDPRPVLAFALGLILAIFWPVWIGVQISDWIQKIDKIMDDKIKKL